MLSEGTPVFFNSFLQDNNKLDGLSEKKWISLNVKILCMINIHKKFYFRNIRFFAYFMCKTKGWGKFVIIKVFN